ncbi:MAG: pseudouridine synthase [Betaproteobacteria bacterium]
MLGERPGGFSVLIGFNKPYGVICQFSPSGDKPTLKNFIDLPDIYPAGRLDTDSEGLLLLTDDGVLQARIADPMHKLAKTYWAQVDGAPTDADLAALRAGVNLGDFVTQPAQARIIAEPKGLWERDPPVRFRKLIPTTWLEIIITEGKNRQVRRMTAKIGFPTLRLVRAAIGNLALADLKVGTWRQLEVPAALMRRAKAGKKP